MSCSHQWYFDIICQSCNLHMGIFIFLNPGDFILQQSLGTADVECGFTGFGMDQNSTLSAPSLLKRNLINDDCLQVSFPFPPLITSGKMKQCLCPVIFHKALDISTMGECTGKDIHLNYVNPPQPRNGKLRSSLQINRNMFIIVIKLFGGNLNTSFRFVKDSRNSTIFPCGSFYSMQNTKG